MPLTHSNHKKGGVLLINPPPSINWDYSKKEYYAPPIGILSIATVLKNNGFSVKVIDGVYDPQYTRHAEEYIREEDVLFIGLSAMTAQLPGALETAQRLRKISPKTPLVWGGIHPSLLPEQAARHELVDVAVIGEGEYTCLEIAQAIIRGQNFAEISGSISLCNGVIIKGTPRTPLSLNDLPFFDYSLLDIEMYIPKNRSDVGGKNLKTGPLRRSLPILSGLGCPYTCAFCVESILKKKYRTRSAEQLIEEIKKLIRLYAINDVTFVDDLFFADKKRLFSFLDLLEQEKIEISWATSVRVNYFQDNYLNPELLKRLRRLGCFHLALGAESGSERILAKIDKQISRDDLLRASSWCKQADINMGFSFMIALPGETKEEMKQTISFAFQLVKDNPNSYIIGPNAFRPYPGSKLYDECVREYGFHIPEKLDDWKKVFSREEGFYKLEDLPWVKDPKFIRILSFYLFRGTTNYIYNNVFVQGGSRILKKLCRLRLKTNFFGMAFEFLVMNHLRSVICNDN